MQPRVNGSVGFSTTTAIQPSNSEFAASVGRRATSPPHAAATMTQARTPDGRSPVSSV